MSTTECYQTYLKFSVNDVSDKLYTDESMKSMFEKSLIMKHPYGRHRKYFDEIHASFRGKEPFESILYLTLLAHQTIGLHTLFILLYFCAIFSTVKVSLFSRSTK